MLIVLFCLAAPLWAEHVAHTGPNENHITDKVMIDGQETDVVAPDGTPLGPGLHGKFLLGADQNGRDVMVRLMYGGRTSIYVGLAAAAVTTILAVVVALLAGYYRGWIDRCCRGRWMSSGHSLCCCSASRLAPRCPSAA